MCTDCVINSNKIVISVEMTHNWAKLYSYLLLISEKCSVINVGTIVREKMGSIDFSCFKLGDDLHY